MISQTEQIVFLTILTRLRAFCPDPAESLFCHKCCSFFPTFSTNLLRSISMVKVVIWLNWTYINKQVNYEARESTYLFFEALALVLDNGGCLFWLRKHLKWGWLVTSFTHEQIHRLLMRRQTEQEQNHRIFKIKERNFTSILIKRK